MTITSNSLKGALEKQILDIVKLDKKDTIISKVPYKRVETKNNFKLSNLLVT